MTYNLQGKRTSLENLAGQVTTTARDCCHKVSETQPDGSATTWDYDAEGRMIAASRPIPLDMTNVTWLTTCYVRAGVCLVLYCSPLDKAAIFGVERLPRIGV